jgi:hypothetical protein
LIVKGQTVLAQGMMTYTAPGAHTDLAVTAAVDLSLRKAETEVNRVANAERLDGSSWSRVEMKGGITVVNHRRDTVKVEISRHLLSAAATADHNGTVRKVSVFEDADVRGSSSYPYWWGWYSWPAWWSRFNGMSKITWEVQVEPGKAIDLGYEWHYFWR